VPPWLARDLRCWPGTYPGRRSIRTRRPAIGAAVEPRRPTFRYPL